MAYFNKFLNDTVNIDSTRLGYLDQRVDSITEALKTSSALDGRVLDTIPQGSWAHRTIIRPPTGLEFDADFLVHLSEDTDWNDNPRRYANAIWNALSGHSTYGSMAKKKDRCSRVIYANDCHIDIVTYVILSDGREVIVNSKCNEFEDTNPIGFSEWIQEKDSLTKGNLRKVLRLLKHLRDHQDSFNLKSVLLTTLVGNIVDGWRTAGDDYYKDVPTTLLHLVGDLNKWLGYQAGKPYIVDPSCPTTSFDHRWTESEFESFRDKFNEIAIKVHDAYHVSTVKESIEYWREVFGNSFPDSATTSTTASAGTALPRPSTLKSSRDRRAPKEQFIEEMFPVSEIFSLRIDCEVSEPAHINRRERRQLRARAGHVPKQHSLRFYMVETSVPKPFDMYWKVRNYGTEAEARHQLRGEIIKDSGSLTRTESTSYAGHHYVECYIVKDGVCVARANQPVIIN
ncbi:nucleotide-binding domain-containing protein [Nocardia amikacinitolerans]|uniref:nucleotide-binding domain-containing protein n=1 Tax=Nocardia amikacinitolerans TaxID=756689 RepID=UPI00117C6859|nr:nucleotidyltransferase [Nocardia amikacinitolerans]